MGRILDACCRGIEDETSIADGRFIDCEECRWAQFRIREWLDDRGECHDEEVIVCSKPKEAKACEG